MKCQWHTSVRQQLVNSSSCRFRAFGSELPPCLIPSIQVVSGAGEAEGTSHLVHEMRGRRSSGPEPSPVRCRVASQAAGCVGSPRSRRLQEPWSSARRGTTGRTAAPRRRRISHGGPTRLRARAPLAVRGRTRSTCFRNSACTSRRFSATASCVAMCVVPARGRTAWARPASNRR